MLLGSERALIDGEIRRDVVLDIDDRGRIATVGDVPSLGAPERVVSGLLIPGLVEAHADLLVGGRTPTLLPGRRAAPRLAIGLDAAALRAIACHHFIDMLRAGITSVGAIVDIHHQPDGEPYRDPTGMADAVALAARDAGIRACLLRAVRLRGDFERAAEGPELRACDPSIDVAADRITFTARRVAGYRDARLSCGVAVHSLAAVPLDALVALKTRLAHLPLHVGAAMDLAEALTCQALYGIGPVELLVRSAVVDGSTSLVGVTNLRPGEVELIALSGAVVCRLAGSDGSDVVKTLEVAGVPVVRAPASSIGLDRLEQSTRAGGQALALRAGRIAPGYLADLVALDVRATDDTLEAPLPVREVIVGGEPVVENGEHPLAASAAREYANAIVRLS